MSHSRGSLLVVTLLVGSALVWFALGYLQMYQGNRTLMMAGEAGIVAEAAASGGLEDAVWNLKRDAGWRVGFDAVRLARSGATYTLTFDAGRPGVAWSTDNLSGATAVTGYGGRVVPAGCAHLVCTGRYGGVAAVEELLVLHAAPFSFESSAFGADTVVLNNRAMTDSWDSRVGPYAQSRQPTGGDIATNGAAAGAVQLKQGAVVGGDVRVGPGGTSAVVSGAGTYNQLVTPPTAVVGTPPRAPAGVSLGPVDAIASVDLPAGRYGDLTVSNRATVTLSAGTYVFSSILSKGQDVTFNVSSSPVVVYFTGTLDLGQGTRINATGRPADLTFLGTSTASKVILGQGSSGAFALYAPAAQLTLGQGSVVYGAVAARALDLGQATAIHYDRALLDSRPGGDGKGETWTVLSRW